MWSTILIVFLALACLAVGSSFIFDWWTPFKEEKSVKVIGNNGEKRIETRLEKAPLSKKEKWFVGILASGIIVSLLSLIFVFNPPWLAKLRERMNRRK
ncbi:MAG: hypothetical protein AB1465_03285 [Patescibacteria group bacterium]